MSYDGSRAIAWAETQVGFHEGPNNRNPYSLWQYGNSYNPWCASFQCMANYMGGYRFKNCTYGEKGEAYTPTEKVRAQEQGTFRDKSYRAHPGDAVLFDWGNNGLIDHVEVVKYDNGQNLITVGGNTSDAVMYRTRDRKYVAGFWALSQDKSQAAPSITAADLAAIAKLAKWEKSVTKDNPIRQAETSNRVSVLVDLLIQRGLLARKSNTYNLAVAQAVNHYKRAHNFPNEEGGTVGPQFAHDILTRRIAA